MTTLEELESKIFDLEFAQLKKLAAKTMPKLRSKPTPKSAEVSGSLTLYSTRIGGKRVYRLGDKILPNDRRVWPAEIREMADLADTVDKGRLHGGRMISETGDPVHMVY